MTCETCPTRLPLIVPEPTTPEKLMPSHKRQASDREVTFRTPQTRCFACYDTGCVCNSDGALWDYLRDYDHTEGRPTGGTDLALICHCEAARSAFAPDGSVIRQGLREGSGRIHSVDTEQGPRTVGADVPLEWVTALHQRRLEAWRLTVMEVSRVRQRRLAGEPTASPWFISEVRDQAMAAIQSFVQKQERERSMQRGREQQRLEGHRLQSLGQVLAQAGPITPDQG